MSTKGGYEEAPRWESTKPDFPGIPTEARWDVREADRNDRITKEFVVPIFVELVETSDQSVASLIEFLEKSTDLYSVPDYVMDQLASERVTRRDGGPLTFMLLSRPDSVENRFWKVISAGPPQARIFRPDGFTRGKPITVKTGPLCQTPVVGIIDDSIAFLNHRFRHSDGTTRFRHLWIMHADTLAGDPGPFGGPPVLYGIELTQGDIDTRITSQRSEESLYRQINMGIFGAAVRHSTAFHAGHGSHVLDLATGADKGEDMADVPILGVQLSPSSIAETSGEALNWDVARALSWTVTRALQMPGRFPLVINLSLGSLAGPQDGTSLVERWIAFEIRRYHHFSGHAPIRVVIAYGNALRSRLVADVRLAPGKEASVDWRILPDDATKSTLELRTPKGVGPTINVSMSPPDGGLPLNRPLFRGNGLIDLYTTPAGVVAEAADKLETGTNTAFITVAPTIRSDTRPAACSGNWKVTLRNDGTAPVTVKLRVQRDDTPGGYRRNGRQSWLDHPDAAGFELATRAYTLPAPSGPITRKGSEVSYAGFQHPSVYFVGAARPDPMAKDEITFKEKRRPALYASEGALPKPDSPTLSALGDEGSALRGLRAAGNLSGSTARMSGSSMAAPEITRRLLKLAMDGDLGPQPALGAPHDPVELKKVLRKAPEPVAHAQLGWGTVVA
ncbi:MAG: hypothetical protein ACRC6I_22130 [Paracoccaceae bacterium]